MLHVLPPSPRLLRRDDPVGRSATRAWGGRLKGQVTGRVAWIDVRFGSEANICAAKSLSALPPIATVKADTALSGPC